MKLLLASIVIAALFPLAAAAETWRDTHTRGCALGFASSAFGILTANGTLRVTVTGEVANGTIKVQSLKLN